MPLIPQIRRALLTYATAMLASAACIWLLTAPVDMQPVPAQVVTILLLVTASFLVNALWTFRQQNRTPVA
jgi:putative flippase GtrA